VVLDMFPADRAKGTWHIHLGLWADLMLIAPASANTIAKLAHGFADNALASLALAIRCPLVVAPAMDTDMYVHTATRQNIEILRGRGVGIIEPESGELASGLVGPGRLPDTAVLVDAVRKHLPSDAGDLAGHSVLVTAGPTREAIDPVRYIGNRSSGKMGFAVAEAAARRGADVTLVAGPVSLPTPEGVHRVDVESAREMHDAVMQHRSGKHISILAAAVADYTVEHPAEQKIKKDTSTAEGMALELVRTADILATLGKDRADDGVLVGFALETEHEIENATRKLRAKHADMIVLNNPRNEGAAFGGDTNIATVIFADESVEEIGLLPKRQLADVILDRALGILRRNS
jgi:phosphopantothenoylcysteine decarboxylase/phosphopantothenate--cysteine ligase